MQNALFIQKFLDLATDAGSVPDRPSTVVPSAFWINILFNASRLNWPVYVRNEHDDGGGVLENLCEASATFCAALVREEKERRAVPTDAWSHNKIRSLIRTVLVAGGAKQSSAGSPPPPAKTKSMREMIDQFIAQILADTGKVITRKDIWLVAGYQDRSEFQKFQRDDPTTRQSARTRFSAVLKLSPIEFMKRLSKLRSIQ